MRQPPQDPLSNEPNQRQCFSINKLMSRCLHFSKMKSEIRLRAETGFDPDSLPHLKNLFIGTHRGATWVSFLQLSPFELFETVARRVQSQFVALECTQILCNIVSYERRNYFLRPLDPSEMQIGKRYGKT